MAVGKTIRKVGGHVHLFRANASAKHGGAHVKQTRLLLGIDPNVVAIRVIGRVLFCRSIKLKPHTPL